MSHQYFSKFLKVFFRTFSIFPNFFYFSEFFLFFRIFSTFPNLFFRIFQSIFPNFFYFSEFFQVFFRIFSIFPNFPKYFSEFSVFFRIFSPNLSEDLFFQKPGSLQANSRLQSSVLHQPPDGLGSAVGPNMQPFQVHCSISSSQGSPGLPAAGARSRAEKEKLGTPNSSFSLLHSLIVKVFYRLSECFLFSQGRHHNYKKRFNSGIARITPLPHPPIRATLPTLSAVATIDETFSLSKKGRKKIRARVTPAPRPPPKFGQCPN